MMKYWLFILAFLFIGCVQEIPVEELEEETFTSVDGGSSSPPKAPTPPVPVAEDKSAPVIVSLSPSGMQPSSTSSVVLQASTNEESFCRYDKIDKDYDQMLYNLPSSDGGSTHLRSLPVKAGEKHHYFVRCMDAKYNEQLSSTDLVFEIAAAGMADTTNPVVSSILPAGELEAGTTSVDLVLTSSEASVCKYSSNAVASFDQMLLLTTSNGIAHTKSISPIVDGSKLYFSCKDLAGNPSAKKEVAYTIKKEAPPEPPVNLELAAREILAKNCLACHGGSATYKGLDVSADSSLFNPVDKFIVKGKPDESKIYLSLSGSDSISLMPASGAIPAAEQKIIGDWIASMSPPVDTPAITCNEESDKFSPLTRRLTKKEIGISIKELLGSKYRPSLDSLQDDGKSRYGMTRNGASQGGYSPQAVEMLYDLFEASIASAVADKAVAGNCQNMSGAEFNTCLDQNLIPLVQRAWRRILTPAEKVIIYGYFKDKTFDQGMAVALMTTFTSARFLFISYDDDITPRKLNSFEIAERLAFLITSRVPTQRLMDVAATTDLSIKENLLKEMHYMFDMDNVDRTDDMRRNNAWMFFAELQHQWLELDGISDIKPGIDTPYNTSHMNWGTLFYIEEMFRKNRSINQMMTDNFAVVTESTDHLYKANFSDGAEGEYDIYLSPRRYRKISTDASERKGLLTQAAILAINAHADAQGEVNPTSRGLWHADNILCDLPGGLPAEVDLGEDQAMVGSLKEKLKAHTDKGGACFNCHKIMDPVGFGLWGFDSLGQTRNKDVWGFDVDPSGELEGQFFQTASQMIDVISESQKTEQCVVSHITSYIVAHDVDSRQSCVSQKIMKEVKEKNGGLKDILEKIVTSDHFIMRK